MSDGKKSVHFVILPHSIDESFSLVARNFGGPALVAVREMILHEVPDLPTDNRDGFTLRNIKESLLFVNSYTATEKLTYKQGEREREMEEERWRERDKRSRG